MRIARAPKHRLRARGKKKIRVVFRFTSSEAGSTFRCGMDKQGPVPCSSPRKYRVRPGRHSFTVQAVDAAGNTGAPVSYSFKVVRK